VNVFAPIRDYIDSLVHPSAQHDALTAARHRAFIAPRLLGSFGALAAFPVYLVMRGVPSALEVCVFAWLVAPILISYYLSKTGRYEGAHVLSSLALTGLVTALAVGTGGIQSFAAVWLIVVPLEAALSASRRVIGLASLFALTAAGFLLVLGITHMLPVPGPGGQEFGALAALGIISATLYATGLALGAESLARTSFWLLYAEEDRYRLLAHNMTDVITRHGRNGAVLFASPAAEPLFGTPVRALLGHGLFDRVHVADRPAYLTALADAAAYGQDRSVEFRVRREAADITPLAGGQFVWVEMRCRPVDRTAGKAGSGHDGEIVAVMRDVTERKRQEQALEDARTGAERANVAKSRFLATISHELRTPLNVIIGFSEMLLKEDTMMLDARRRQDYAKHINDSGHHLLSVVNGILDMSKIETGDFPITPEPFEPAEVIDHCCELLRQRAHDAGIDLAVRLPAGLPEIVADKRALKQIVLNLLSNSIKFTDRGGCVTVSARADGMQLALAVEDTGVGISEDDLPRLGEPFFQARTAYDRRHDGTGLGLSIVRGLVALHGGQLEIRSRLGKGTQVHVRLPLDCERAFPAAGQSKISQHLRAGRPAAAPPAFPVKKSA
jgi:cell cycle sensor histidine kinase DivJ